MHRRRSTLLTRYFVRGGKAKLFDVLDRSIRGRLPLDSEITELLREAFWAAVREHARKLCSSIAWQSFARCREPQALIKQRAGAAHVNHAALDT